MTFFDQYRACGNPACLRKLAGGARYCCGGCATAHENRYDPDGYHTGDCEARAVERGEWTFLTRPALWP